MDKLAHLNEELDDDPLESERPSFNFSVYEVSLLDLSVYPAMENFIGPADPMDLYELCSGIVISLVVSRCVSERFEGIAFTWDKSGGKELHEEGPKSSSADSCAAAILLMEN